MNSAVQSFNRYEFKYWIDDRAKFSFLNYIKNFMDFDDHCRNGTPYRVNSLYFDTRDLACYYEKYNGDTFRRKYRVRFYGTDLSRLFFEVKEKHNIFIRKKRRVFENETPDTSEIPELFFRDRPDGEDPFFHAYHEMKLQPLCWVSYRRTALFGQNNPQLRITIDEDLSGVLATGLTVPSDFRSLFFSNWQKPIILEIKFTRFLPHWLEQAIREIDLSHESISKFGISTNRNYFHVWDEMAWTH